MQQPNPVLASMLLADKRGGANAGGAGGVTLVQAVANILGELKLLNKLCSFIIA